MVPGLLPIFLHGCEIKSGSGLGTRLVPILQLVSRHVIESSGDRFKKVSYGSRESGWPSSDSSWQCYYMLGTTAKLSMPFQVYSS